MRKAEEPNYRYASENDVIMYFWAIHMFLSQKVAKNPAGRFRFRLQDAKVLQVHNMKFTIERLVENQVPEDWLLIHFQ